MIIWIASYPKSGNTLIRAILTSLIFSEDGIVDFKNLHRISNFSNGFFFKKFISSYENILETSKYWIKAQEELNKNKYSIWISEIEEIFYKMTFMPKSYHKLNIFRKAFNQVTNCRFMSDANKRFI